MSAAGHLDGSPRAVEARERAMLACPIWRAQEARHCERLAALCEANGAHDTAADLRAAAARFRGAAA